ncbi:hypothetical protein ElyMa_004480800 [Elysia marginata]|uniref:Uncharacterized protein n=1 Tax=Elysia marginata TaxID=1093978 RepID=A0AAV4HJE9_9GAST|nr:hypothetical protein ElyMa_004480800 [Elysia marginata]
MSKVLKLCDRFVMRFAAARSFFAASVRVIGIDSSLSCAALFSGINMKSSILRLCFEKNCGNPPTLRAFTFIQIFIIMGTKSGFSASEGRPSLGVRPCESSRCAGPAKPVLSNPCKGSAGAPIEGPPTLDQTSALLRPKMPVAQKYHPTIG